jgi:hypothetical protein
MKERTVREYSSFLSSMKSGILKFESLRYGLFVSYSMPDEIISEIQGTFLIHIFAYFNLVDLLR